MILSETAGIGWRRIPCFHPTSSHNSSSTAPSTCSTRRISLPQVVSVGGAELRQRYICACWLVGGSEGGGEGRSVSGFWRILIRLTLRRFRGMRVSLRLRGKYWKWRPRWSMRFYYEAWESPPSYSTHLRTPGQTVEGLALQAEKIIEITPGALEESEVSY